MQEKLLLYAKTVYFTIFSYTLLTNCLKLRTVLFWAVTKFSSVGSSDAFLVNSWVTVESELLPGRLPGGSGYIKAGRFWWWHVIRFADANRTTVDCLELTVLSSMILALLLTIGGIEQNPGPVLEVENTVRLLCVCALGIWSQESNINYVNNGIIIVMEVRILNRQREREL